MNEKMHFTKELLEKLPYPEKGRVEYKDKKIAELRMRVTSNNIKTFSVHKRMKGRNGKLVRITLGKFPDLELSKAREWAQKCLSEIAEGRNPNHEKKKICYSEVTLRDALSQYTKQRKLSPRTLIDYASLLRCQLSTFADRKLNDLSRDEIQHLHKAIKSPARADYSMRLLRAVFNFMNTESINRNGTPFYAENPVKILSHRKQWNNVSRRHTHIRINEFPLFIKAIQKVRNDETYTGKSVCDALLFAVLTGLRQSEILNLKWTHLNYKGRYFTLYNTKNKENLELPITPYLNAIFRIREKENKTDYVFSSDNQYGQVRTPRKVVMKVKELSDTNCHFHDLRRTFATTAEHLDIGTYKLKRLMGHKSGRNDVTEGYLILTAETIRPALEAIQEKIVNQMEIFPVWF